MRIKGNKPKGKILVKNLKRRNCTKFKSMPSSGFELAPSASPIILVSKIIFDHCASQRLNDRYAQIVTVKAFFSAMKPV